MEYEDNPIVARRASPPSTDGARLRHRLRDANEQLTLTALTAQEQAEQAADRYRDLLEGLGEIVWEADSNPWRYRFVSQRAQVLFGHPVERWLEDSNFWMDLIHHEDRLLVADACRAATEASRDFRVEFRAMAMGGRTIWLAMSARVRQPEHHSGAPQYRGLLLDVSDAIRADTLQNQVAQQTEELRADQEQLRALATQLNLAEHHARGALSTELHDHLAQLLVLGRLHLGQAKRVRGLVPECGFFIQKAEEALNESLLYTRTLITNLSPPALQEPGLLPALRWLAEQMKEYRLVVEIQAPELPEPSIPEDRKFLLYQSVRELLINISKHAGTDRAAVSFRYRNGSAHLDVCDEGAGFDPAAAAAAAAAASTPTATSSKFGLFSIQQRMKALGGRFEMQSTPGHGTKATLVL